MTSRLPTPGADDGVWGALLNDFLNQAHNGDGTLKPIAQSQVTGLSGDLAGKASTTDLATKANASELASKASTADLATKANASSLAAVATSGSYNDLSNKPAVAAGNTYTIIYNTSGNSWPARPATSLVPAGCAIYVSPSAANSPTDMQLYDTWRKY